MQDKFQLPLSIRQTLLHAARDAILDFLQDRMEQDRLLDKYPAILREARASFITLNLQGKLRGCIGSLVPHRPLIQDVRANARSAASKDPRFRPVSWGEYHELEIHVSILSPPQEIYCSGLDELASILKPGADGLIIQEEGRSATYLPSVWQQIPDAVRFIQQLRIKAGLDAYSWSEHTRVFNYSTDEFS